MRLYAIRNRTSGAILRVTSASALWVDGAEGTARGTRYLTIDSAIDLTEDDNRRCLFVTPDLEFLAELLSKGGADDFKYPYRFEPGFQRALMDYEAFDLLTGDPVALPAPMDGEGTTA